MSMLCRPKRQRPEQLWRSSVEGSLLVSMLAGLHLGMAYAQTTLIRSPGPVRYTDRCAIQGEWESFQAICDEALRRQDWAKTVVYQPNTSYSGFCKGIHPNEPGWETVGKPSRIRSLGRLAPTATRCAIL